MQSFCMEGIVLLMSKTGKSKANLRNIQNRSSHKTGDKAVNQLVVIVFGGQCVWPPKL